jgi:hypothetical protein
VHLWAVASIVIAAVAVLALFTGRGSGVHGSVGLHDVAGPGPSIETLLAETSKGLHAIRRPPPTPMPSTKVAVLNATTQPGLGAVFGWKLREAGFGLVTVWNYPEVVRRTRVEVDPTEPNGGADVAQVLGVARVSPMIVQTRRRTFGAPIAVIVGADRAKTVRG